MSNLPRDVEISQLQRLDDAKDDIINRIQADYTLISIAEDYGVAVETIQIWIRRLKAKRNSDYA